LARPKKPFNEYSKANWGDHIETREGRAVHINSTSYLVAMVSKLKEKQWKKIFMVARASGKRKKNTATVVSALPSPSQALVEVRDDDSDLADDSDV
jgi:hypothetical protein